MDQTINKSTGSGRDLFFYLLLFFTLTLSALSAGGILFQIINHYWPDAVVNYGSVVRNSALQWWLACFMVASPVFLWVSWKVNKDLAKGLTSLESSVRRVIVYLAMFLASAVIIGDVIGLVFNFVSGQLTTRFIFKVLVILVIGGWINFYYWSELKGRQILAGRWQAYIFAGLGIILLVAGFILSGNPFEQQKLVRDQKRINDLQQIYYSVQNYYQNSQPSVLPGELTEISAGGYYDWLPNDPLTGQAYNYIKKSEVTYSLCASFETESDKQSIDRYVGPDLMNWAHPAGDYCFDIKVSDNQVKPNAR
ncbi:MAG: DUF5671 domain-containing protein [Patescibacteria group bacterium]